MDGQQDLLRFCRKGETDNVKKVMQRIKMTKVLDAVTDLLVNGGDETNLLIKISLDYAKESSSCEKQSEIYKRIFKVMNTEEVNSKMLNDVVGLLTIEMDSLDSKALVLIADDMINAVKSGYIQSDKPLELFSKLIATVTNHEKVPFGQGGTGELKGSEYRAHLLNDLCSCRWDPRVVVHLATIFRDIPMKEEELSFVVSKLIRMLKEVNHQEIPPLAYQILLLSSKGQKEEVIRGLCEFFDSAIPDPCTGNGDMLFQDSENQKVLDHEMQSVEGTVLLHITFAMRQDQDLARILLKFLKTLSTEKPTNSLTTFSLALALSASSIRRLQDSVFDFLKTTIVKGYKDADRRKTSKVIQDLFPERLELEKQILLTVDRCKQGSDCVLEGLVQLGFILLDSFGHKTADTSQVFISTPTSRASKLGETVIGKIFKLYTSTRDEILDRIVDTIAGRNSQNVRLYVELLGSLVATVPQIILDCLPKFREVFNNLAMLKPDTAEDVLRAVLMEQFHGKLTTLFSSLDQELSPDIPFATQEAPIMQVSMNIKDSLMLVLRKSMAARQLEARKVAAVGFMLILKHFKISIAGEIPRTVGSQAPSTQVLTCSQLQIATQGRYSALANESLCLEVIGCLRRSLSQQAEVRLELYEGLYEVICKNPPLSYAVLELLLSQAKKYVESDEDVMPPLRLNSCITASGEQVYLADPMAHLFHSLQLSTRKAARRLGRDPEEDELLSNMLDECEEMLEGLTRRMLKAELEDFELDKSADYSLGSSVGVKNNINACIISGIYEVLMELSSSKGDMSQSACETTMRLFQNHTTLSQILKEKSSGPQGKKGRSAAIKQSARSLLSLKTLATLIHSIFSDTSPEHTEGLQLFRQSLDFCKFLATCACQKLTQVLESGRCDGPGGKNSDHIFKQCCSLARSFLQQVSSDTCLPTDVMKKDKGKRITVICLEGFHLATAIVCSRFSDNLGEYLNSLEFSQNFETQRSTLDSCSLVFRNIRKLQRMIINIFAMPEEDMGVKEGQQLIGTISLLVQHIDGEENELAKVYAWLQRICLEQNLDEVTSAKAVLTFLLNLHHRTQTSTKLVKQIAQDIHIQLGDIEEEVAIEAQPTFIIINPRTAAPTTFVLLISHLEKMIEESDWLLTKLRNQISVNGKANKVKNIENDNDEFAEKLDGSICYQLLGCIMAFHELTQTAFPEGICADTMTKVLTRLYTTLGNLSKYYLGLYSQKVGHLSAKFERLVKLTGTHLAQQVYAMITYMQATQAQSMQNVLEKTVQGKKGKEKKKISKSLSHEKNQAIKEARSIPNLIYSIEQYERFLIQLSKKSKINLMENFKRSTSRDFRINGATLEAALQVENEDLEKEISITGEESVNGVPLKRQRMDSNVAA